MRTLKNISILIAALFITSAAFAQTDNNEASHSVDVNWTDLMIMDIENTSGDNAINLDVDYGNHEAGEGLTDGDVLASDETTWLNWTVFAPTSNGTYHIQASVGSAISSGWSLKATPSIDNVSQGAATAASGTALTTTDQDMVTGIANLAWSGNGASSGCKIKYEVVVDDADGITASDETVNVTYTISAE